MAPPRTVVLKLESRAARLTDEISALESVVARERRRVKVLRLTKMRGQQRGLFFSKPPRGQKKRHSRRSIEASALRMELESLEVATTKTELSRDEARRLVDVARDKLDAVPAIWGARQDEARVLETETRKLATERANLDEDVRLVNASSRIEHDIRSLHRDFREAWDELGRLGEEHALWKTKLHSAKARRDPLQKHVDELREELAAVAEAESSGTTTIRKTRADPSDALFNASQPSSGGDELAQHKAHSLLDDNFERVDLRRSNRERRSDDDEDALRSDNSFPESKKSALLRVES